MALFLLQNIDKIPLVNCPVLVIHVSLHQSFHFISYDDLDQYLWCIVLNFVFEVVLAWILSYIRSKKLVQNFLAIAFEFPNPTTYL